MQQNKNKRHKGNKKEDRVVCVRKIALIESDLEGATGLQFDPDTDGHMLIHAPSGCDSFHLNLMRQAEAFACLKDGWERSRHRLRQWCDRGDVQWIDEHASFLAILAFTHPRDFVTVLQLAIFIGKDINIWATACAQVMMQPTDLMNKAAVAFRSGDPVSVNDHLIDALAESTDHAQEEVMIAASEYCPGCIWPAIRSSKLAPEITSIYPAMAAIRGKGGEIPFDKFDEIDHTSCLEACTAARLVSRGVNDHPHVRLEEHSHRNFLKALAGYKSLNISDIKFTIVPYHKMFLCADAFAANSDICHLELLFQPDTIGMFRQDTFDKIFEMVETFSNLQSFRVMATQLLTRRIKFHQLANLQYIKVPRHTIAPPDDSADTLHNLKVRTVACFC